MIDADTMNNEEDDEADSPVYLNTTKPSGAPAKRKQQILVWNLLSRSLLGKLVPVLCSRRNSDQ